MKNNLSLFKRIRGIFSSDQDKNYFIENLSMLIGSGMGVLQSLDAVSTDLQSYKMKLTIEQIKNDILSGLPLWKALQGVKMFPEHFIMLIKTGEESGKLSENLQIVGLQQEKERQFRSKISSAIMYPVFVISMTVILGTGIAWFILPRLAVIFAQFKLQMPLITQILIVVGIFLKTYGAIVIPSALSVLIVFLIIAFYIPKTKFIGQTIIFHIPGIRNLVMQTELARFGYLLGTLLGAGLPITLALRSVVESTMFPQYRKLYVHLSNNLEEGNSFQKSFASFPGVVYLIPTPIQQLVVSAEQSGNLSGALLKINQNYESKADTTTKNLAIILEPILLLVVWVGVLGVALAVILPIYNLIGGFSSTIR